MKEKIKRGNQNKGGKPTFFFLAIFFWTKNERENGLSLLLSGKINEQFLFTNHQISTKNYVEFFVTEKKMSWHTLHYHFFFWENFPFFKRKKKFDHHFNYREKKRRRREERDKKVRDRERKRER